MASVDLTHVWLHDASDHSTYVTLRARNISASPRRDISQQVYAGGVVRAVSTPATTRTVMWDAIQVGRDTLDVLNEWLGRTLMYRDPRGHVEFGFLRDLAPVEPLWTVKAQLPQMTLHVISHSIEV